MGGSGSVDPAHGGLEAEPGTDGLRNGGGGGILGNGGLTIGFNFECCRDCCNGTIDGTRTGTSCSSSFTMGVTEGVALLLDVTFGSCGRGETGGGGVSGSVCGRELGNCDDDETGPEAETDAVSDTLTETGAVVGVRTCLYRAECGELDGK